MAPRRDPLAPDPDLVAALADGDPGPMEELFRRHSAAVNGVAWRATRSPSLAEEVTQEVFLRLWRSPHRYDPTRGSLRTFLVMEANARAIEVVRSDVGRRGREERHETAAPARGASVEDQVWDGMLVAHLVEALEALPAGERDAIELAYYGGHTYVEVAAILGEPEGTVKSRIRAGLHRLRDRLMAVEQEQDPWPTT